MTSLSSVRLPFSSTTGSESSSRSTSPTQLRNPPYQLPSRSQTIPLPSRPISDDTAISQDNAYPTFPGLKATPEISPDPQPTLKRIQTEPLKAVTSNRFKQNSASTDAKKGVLPPRSVPDVSPVSNDAMDEEKAKVKSSHSRNTSMSSSRDFSRPASTGAAKFHMPRPSASSSVYTRNRSTSTVSGTSRYDWDAPEVPLIPSKSNSPAGLDGAFDFGLDKPKESPAVKKKEDPILESPLESPIYSHKPRPSVTAAMAPLHSIGSSSSFKPSRSMRGRKASVATTQAPPVPVEALSGQEIQKVDVAPPISKNHSDLDLNAQNGVHTPHESTSSNGSSTSGAKSGSSRSSPPLQESPRKYAYGHNQAPGSENSFDDFQFGIGGAPAQRRGPPEIFTGREPLLEKRSQPVRPPSLSIQPTLPVILPPEPQTPDYTGFSNSPDDYMISSNLDTNAEANQYHLSPLSPTMPESPTIPDYFPPPAKSASPPQRLRPPDKGPCRGCGETIRGKSVRAQDGRLTGRYHKGCFVCTTCNSPFQTADFYVIKNHPYCGRHYHELNNSLCQGCNRGIEGQYLETETYRKYHSYCFTCQECHKILKDDYFQWQGRTLCEQHAFKAANQPSSTLGLGARRFPEKRSTRLMMM